MTHMAGQSVLLIWIGIVLCILQTALFSGLNLAVFSVSKLRLELEATGGDQDAKKVLALRDNSNQLLATIVWGNVATNVVLTLLSESVLAGVGAFVFSTLAITMLGEIIPQAYFSRNATRMVALLTPFLMLYRLILYPVAKPTAMLLDWWLGAEGVTLFRERDFRVLLTRHAGGQGTDLSRLEAIGARNLLELDDIPAGQEGEPVDPLSIICLPRANGRPVLPAYERSLNDPFLKKVNLSGRKWVIFVDEAEQPCMVLDAHHFLRDVLHDDKPDSLERSWHRPLIVTDAATCLGTIIGRMKVKPERPDDDVVDLDMALVWDKQQRRIITGADILGRLLRGIAMREGEDAPSAVPASAGTQQPDRFVALEQIK
jgi:metal transporter CNNM